MRALVTGAAGFIGSHLCDSLIARGAEVWGVDNLHLGQMRNIAHLGNAAAFHFEEFDLLESGRLDALFASTKFDAVFHLAANSDIAAGNKDASLDLRLNHLTTAAVLECMRAAGTPKLFFASTSAVFGELEGAIAEKDGPLQPISFYGASKLAAEAYISVYAHTFGVQSVMLRFPNVVGERATHGAIFDFIKKLANNSHSLDVLGDGRQTKPYLYVADLIEAILLAFDTAWEPLSVYHAAGVGETSVKTIAEVVASAFGAPGAEIKYGGGARGWPGDVPRFAYNTEKLLAIGWRPRLESTAAVKHAVERIRDNGF